MVNKTDPPARRRFTEGHEYCHFLVAREAVEGEICTPGRRRELFEIRANAFAAAFLLPERGIRDALEDADVVPGEVGPENVVHLMQRFGASREAILWRLLNLRLIASDQRKALSQFAVADLRERLGYELEPGQSESAPDRYRRLAVEAWRMKQMPTKELAQVLDLPPRDVPKIFSTDRHPRRSAKRLIEEPDWL